MTERQYKELKAAQQQMLRDRNGLLRRIRLAELHLMGRVGLMQQLKQDGKQQDYEAIHNDFQQTARDCTKLLRQLEVINDELKRIVSSLKPVDDYFQETGFFPGL